MNHCATERSPRSVGATRARVTYRAILHHPECRSLRLRKTLPKTMFADCRYRVLAVSDRPNYGAPKPYAPESAAFAIRRTAR